MDKADMLTIWGYNNWANAHILAAAGRLSEEELRQPLASGHGTLFATLLHLVDTEYGWRLLVESGAETPVLSEDDLPNLKALADRAEAEAAAWNAYLATLTDADMAGVVRYVVEGEARERVLWHVLVHVVNHGTHHRGEAAAALTALGQSPGELDFTIFLRS